MILSHARRFIFIKTPKTGSTSIEVALRELCGPDDVITPIGKEISGQSPKWGAPNCGPQNYGDRFFSHMPLAQIRKYAPSEAAQYRKIAFVRNPWDRQISLYHFLRFRGEVTCPFAQWLLSSRPKTLFNMLTVDGELAVDFAGRYERIDDDFARLCRELGCEPPKLQRLNAVQRPPNDDFHTYYDTAAREHVAAVCAKEIAAFGYSYS